ncbi:MAG: prolyl oligopeptidase family serine peptidase [Roseomonas sp.]|nr:prolyl oligopeptidase family serine peptidase [Roseomonas sp.]
MAWLLFHGAMLRLIFLLLPLLAMPAMAQPQAIAIPAHPAEQAANGPATLNAVLWQPIGRGPHAALVLVHGCAGMNTRTGQPFARDADWARRLSQLGYLVLQVDSLTPRNEGSLCGKGNDRRVRMSVERARDAYAGLLFLQARADVRADRIALMGWSNGGGTVLWTLSRDNRARPAGLRHDFSAGIAFYPGCRTLSERREAWQPVAPVLLLVGEADDWTPAPPCATLAARTGPRLEARIYPGAIMILTRPIRRNAFCAVLAPPAAARPPSGRIPQPAKMLCDACRNFSHA